MGVRLTADVVEAELQKVALAPRDYLVTDTLQPGFAVRITPSGSALFVVRKRRGGSIAKVTIGSFPDMSVKDARTAARDLIARWDDAPEAAPRPKRGRPVVTEPKPEPVAEPSRTWADAIDDWLENHVRVKLKPRTAADYEQIGAALKTRFGRIALDKLTKADVRRLHTEMSATPRRANYVVQVLSAIANFAEIPKNPTKGVTRYREGVRERVMSTEELSRAFKAIADLERDGKLSVWACGALRFAIATGARPSEIRAIEWKHLHEEMQRVVLPDSKANRPRILYCSSAAWAILKGMPRFGKFVFAGAAKDTAYQNLTLAWIKVRARAGLDDVRLYDCRHTFASEAAKAGHNLPMIGALLGHTVAATTNRYVHLVGDPAMKAAQDVGDRLAEAVAAGGEGVTARAGRKVVPLRRKVGK